MDSNVSSKFYAHNTGSFNITNSSNERASVQESPKYIKNLFEQYTPPESNKIKQTDPQTAKRLFIENYREHSEKFSQTKIIPSEEEQDMGIIFSFDDLSIPILGDNS